MNIKRRLYLYFILLFLTGIIIVTLYYSSQYKPSLFFPVRDITEIEDEGVLRVAIGYNNIEMMIVDDSLEGFQYDLVREISKLTSLQIEIIPLSSLDECYNELNHNRIDIIAHFVPIVRSKTDEYLFSSPVAQNKIVLIQRKSPYNDNILPIRNLIDLGGKTIVIPVNSNIINRIQNLSEEIADTIHIIESEDYEYEQLIIQVASGEIDFTATTSDFAIQMGKKLQEIDFETPLGFTQNNGWIMRKESIALCDSVNRWLSILEKNGILGKLKDKYLN